MVRTIRTGAAFTLLAYTHGTMREGWSVLLLCWLHTGHWGDRVMLMGRREDSDGL